MRGQREGEGKGDIVEIVEKEERSVVMYNRES
jgi:hypothetical protein